VSISFIVTLYNYNIINNNEAINNSLWKTPGPFVAVQSSEFPWASKSSSWKCMHNLGTCPQRVSPALLSDVTSSHGVIGSLITAFNFKVNRPGRMTLDDERSTSLECLGCHVTEFNPRRSEFAATSLLKISV
jgi:hypothetical protein